MGLLCTQNLCVVLNHSPETWFSQLTVWENSPIECCSLFTLISLDFCSEARYLTRISRSACVEVAVSFWTTGFVKSKLISVENVPFDPKINNKW